MVKRTSPVSKRHRRAAAELERFERELSLTCAGCGRTASYSVGGICIDPRPSVNSIADRVGFTGCFRCRECDSIGPWEFPLETETILLGLTLRCLDGDVPGSASLGRLELFDGTQARTGEEAVAHLRSLITKDPENAFLWSRLGNTYRAADRQPQAAEAYREALEFDETDVESAHSLAQILGEIGAPEGECAELFHLVIKHAWKKKDSIPSTLLRGCVRSALEELLELHEATDGRIDVFPEATLDPSTVRDSTTAVLEMRTLDLSSDAGWEDFVSHTLREPCETSDDGSVLFGGRRPGRRGVRPRSSPTRNGPCPSDSGRKYKNCCARR